MAIKTMRGRSPVDNRWCVVIYLEMQKQSIAYRDTFH